MSITVTRAWPGSPGSARWSAGRRWCSAARELLGTARHDLAEATATTVATERYAAAHLAALRTAAAVLAVRTRPAATKRPRNVWSMLPQVAPELTEWAAFFAAGAEQAGRRRGRADPGGHPAGGRRPAAGRADLPGPGRDDARAGPPAGAAAPGTAEPARAGRPHRRPARPDLDQPTVQPSRPSSPPTVHPTRETIPCPAIPSSTSTSPPATRCATAPRTRTCWSSGPPSTAWTPWR